MKTIDVEVALMRHYNIREKLIVPNVSDWSFLVKFEADLLVLTKSRYATAIEIKVTKSDLKADLKKSHIKEIEGVYNTLTPNMKRWYSPLKHFYYAVPENLMQDALNQIPPFCGLFIVKSTMLKSGINYHYVEQVKDPKTLYKNQWTEEQRYQLARLGTMRILRLKEKLVNPN